MRVPNNRYNERAMLRLEDLTTGTILRGIRPNEHVTVETVRESSRDLMEVKTSFFSHNSTAPTGDTHAGMSTAWN